MRKSVSFLLSFAVCLALLPAAGRAASFRLGGLPDKLEPCLPGDPCLRMLWPADPGKPGEMVELAPAGAPRSEVIESALGKTDGAEIDWQTAAGEVVATSRIAKLPARGLAWAIETTTKKAITAPTGEFGRVHFAFPAVRPPKAQRRVLNYVQETFCPHKHWPIPTSGPTIMFNNDLDVTIVSPLDHFLSSIQQPVGGEYRCGFEGEIQSIPAGTVFKAILVQGRGLNATMDEWGRLLRAWYGTARPDSYADIGLSHLGYWTDNGAYYYYKTEPGMNYHDTLIAVKKYADEQHIPYAYFQLDSWWYPKTKDVPALAGETKGRGGAWLWEPMPELFPQGLPAFRAQLGLPLIAHNRWYDSHSPYCKKYECVIGEEKSFGLPLAPAFWDEIMDNAVKYGVVVYEQDWLYTQYRDIPWLRQGLDRAETWFDNMAGAAARRGLTMQLCMASPGFLMQSVKHNNITQVRTSFDYHAYLTKARYWPAFHTANMFAAAVGLWPFKDNFFTTPGQDKMGGEHWPLEETLISVLSAGMVGPGDKIGGTDVALLMKTCRKDGLLLKPDVPALPLDATFVNPGRPLTVAARSTFKFSREQSLGGYWTSGGVILGTCVEPCPQAKPLRNITVTYLAAFNVEPWKTFQSRVTMKELGLTGKQVVWDWRKQKLTVVEEDGAINFGRMPLNDAFYYIITPVLDNGMAIIGETDKFVTMSSQRFTLIKAMDYFMVFELDLAGLPGEEIGVLIYSPAKQPSVTGGMVASAGQPGLYRIAVKFGDTGKATLLVE